MLARTMPAAGNKKGNSSIKSKLHLNKKPLLTDRFQLKNLMGKYSGRQTT